MVQKVLGNQFPDPQLPYLFFPKSELPNDTQVKHHATFPVNLFSTMFLPFYKRKAFFSSMLL